MFRLRYSLWILIATLTVMSAIFREDFGFLELKEAPVLQETGVPFILEDPPVVFEEILLEDQTGRSRSLRQETNKVILVNFWATWCLPCIQELPSLMRLSQHLRDEPFELLTVSLDRQGKSVVEPFLMRNDLVDLPVLFDPGSHTMPIFDIYGLPTTILIGAAGRIRGRLQGFAVWDSAETIDLIRGYYPDRL